MDNGRISTRYAKAVYDYALEKGEETRLYEEMKTLSENFFSFPTLRKVMEDPTVQVSEKKKVLTTAAGIKVSETFERLLNLVMSHKREVYFQFIALMYQEYYRKKKGMVITRLTTIHPVSPAEKNKLEQLVSKELQAQVDLVEREDDSLIGGFILEVNDQSLDASIRTQLSQLKQELIKMK